MTIGQLASEFAVQPSTLRFYDRIGLLAPAGRISGRREYDKAAERRLALILSARRSGFTLREIKRLVLTASRGTPPRQLWPQAAEEKRRRLQKEIARLREAQRSLEPKTACRCRTLQECERRLAREWHSS